MNPKKPVVVRLIETECSFGINVADAEELRRALLDSPGVESAYCGRTRARLLAGLLKLKGRFLPRNKGTTPGGVTYFSVLMAGVGLSRSPQFLYAKNRAVYLFDCWPEHRESIRRYLSEAGVQNVMINSHRFVSEIESMGLNLRAHYVPEAVDIEEYLALPFERKDIDVIEFGRKHPEYHRRICESLKSNDRRHQHGILDTREAFVEALSRSRVSICFPRTMTTPGLDPKFEFCSMRYLQSIASKCLVVGKAPADLIKLFGYNPVIEADLENPEEQIESILGNFDSYGEFIERNRKTLYDNHTWKHRAADILAILAEDL